MNFSENSQWTLWAGFCGAACGQAFAVQYEKEVFFLSGPPLLWTKINAMVSVQLKKDFFIILVNHYYHKLSANIYLLTADIDRK